MRTILSVLFSLASITAAAEPAGLTLNTLRCEYQTDPLGVDVSMPRLSWTLASGQRGQRQTAYQVLVATSANALAKDQPDLWDSGKVTSDESIQISYGGKPLTSAQQCFWKVRAWDRDGQPSSWSPVAAWTMGLLAPQDWQAKWITAAGPAMPSFRKEFTAAKPIQRATVHVCGLGQFELSLNGKTVGDDLLQPGWTNYRKTCLYLTYDLTNQIKPGANAIGVMLGNGMYNVVGGRYTKFKGSFGQPKLIAQLHLDYADGSRDIVVSDGTWKTAPSPITFSCVYGGEDYDARVEQPGWDTAGFPDGAWSPATVTDGPGGKLIGLSQSAPAIAVRKLLSPQKISQPKAGVFVYDMGQNCSQMPLLTVQGPAGAQVRITPGELLNGDGTVSQRSSGGPTNFAYTLKGKGQEIWGPRFTYYGARYLQVEGAVPPDADNANGKPVVARLQARFVCSSSPVAGKFECSNPLFNRASELIQWAIQSNMMSVLTDCPHREKLGWLEESHLMGPSVMYSYHTPLLLSKICGDMRDAQLDNGLVPDIAPEYTVFSGGFRDSPEWGSAAVLVPWNMYRWYGDLSVLRQHYPMMKRYVDYLGTKAKNDILSHGLGDWYDLGPKPPGSAQLTPIALTATAFYQHDAAIVAKVAELLGNPDDARRYGELAARVRQAFNATFFKADTGTYATGSQCSNALALAMDLADPPQRPKVLERIVEDVRTRGNALSAGDVGYRYVLRALAAGGRSDVIFDMNSRSDRPGYGMQIARGATSLTEAWDTNPNSSQNHFMLGHIQEWFYADLAGIQNAPDSIAFKKIVIKPAIVGDVTWAKASYDSVRGSIASSWKRENGKLTLEVTIPPGTTAQVYLPARSFDSITESGNPAPRSAGVRCVRIDGGLAQLAVESGVYAFNVLQ